jgi:hypothetical protein
MRHGGGELFELLAELPLLACGGGVLPEGEEHGEEGTENVGEESVEQGVNGGSEGEGKVEQLVEHAEEDPHVGQRQRVLSGVGRPRAQHHQLVLHLRHHH